MSEPIKPPVDTSTPAPRRTAVDDREQLREQLSKRFEHTLRRLAR